MMNDSFKLIVECYYKRVKGLKLVRQNIEMFKSMNDLVGMKDTILLYNRLVMTLNMESIQDRMNSIFAKPFEIKL